VARPEYQRQIKERDERWFGTQQPADAVADQWEKAYREQEAVWHA